MADAETLDALSAVRAEIRALTAAVGVTNDRVSALEGPILRILEAATKEPDGQMLAAVLRMANAIEGLSGRLDVALLALAEAGPVDGGGQ